MKTTTHKIEFNLGETDKITLSQIEEWLTDKYGSHEQLIDLEALRTGGGNELHVQFSFRSFDDANRFYRRVIMKMLKDLELTFNARIAGQSSCPSDCSD